MPSHIEYPEISLGETLRSSASGSPEHIAIDYLDTKLTFKELDAAVDSFAHALQGLGVRKGDRVAIYLPNNPQFVIAYYAALRIGGVVVACSPLYKEREVAHILGDSGAKVIVAWDELYRIVLEAKTHSEAKEVITTNARDFLQHARASVTPKVAKLPPSSGVRDMMELLASSESPKPVQIDPRKDIALLQYTGGTTGTPKGAMLTHYNLIANVKQLEAWCGFTARDVHLAVLPLFHIFGMTVAMNAPICTGATMVLLPDPRDTCAVVSSIEGSRPSVFCGVPTMFIALVNTADVGKRNFRSLRLCVSGGSALPVEVQRRFEDVTGARLVEGYGLTEASPVTHINPLDEARKNSPGSIGIPITDTQAKIVDLAKGEHDLAPGEPGELIVSGPQIMMGYWNQTEGSDLAIRGGWLYTGDIAIMDSDGYFSIVDRKKDLIDVSGFKVWPKEVEEVLFEHPAVQEAAVIGVPDSRSGEAVKAFVVLKRESVGKVRAEDLSSFCKDRVAYYKVPKLIEFRSVLPKTAVGKVLRRELKKEAR